MTRSYAIFSCLLIFACAAPRSGRRTDQSPGIGKAMGTVLHSSIPPATRMVAPDEYASKLTIACDEYLSGNFEGARDLAAFLLTQDPASSDARMIFEIADNATQVPISPSMIQESMIRLEKWRYELWNARTLERRPFGIKRVDWFQIARILSGNSVDCVLDFPGAKDCLETLDRLKKTPVLLQIAAGTNLKDLARELSRQIQVPVRVQDSAVEVMGGVATPDPFATRLKFPVNAAQALSIVLRNVPEMVWSVESGEVILRSRLAEEGAGFDTGIFNVSPLVRGVPIFKSRPESLPATFSEYSEGGVCNLMLERVSPMAPEEMERLIKDRISPETWDESTGMIRYFHNNFVVRHRRHELLRIREFLSQLGSAWDFQIQLNTDLDCGATDWQSVEHALGRTVPDMETGKTSLARLLSTLQTTLEVNIVYLGDSSELESVPGLTVGAKATVHDVLDGLKGTTWSMEHGCIYVAGTGKGPGSADNVMSLYDVSDIVWVDSLISNGFKLNGRFLLVYWPFMHSADLVKRSPQTGHTMLQPPGGETVAEPIPNFTLESCSLAIQSTVDPESWMAFRAIDGIRCNPLGTMVIFQTRSNHAKIARLLNAMREMR